MTSWGGARSNKFYKGNKNDTAWNNDLLWIMHCAGLGNIGGRLGTGKQLTTPALNTREVPRTSHGRASSRRTGRSTGRTYNAGKIQKQISLMVQEENRRRAKFDAELKALDEQLKAAKAKEIAALQKQLQTLEEEDNNS